MAAANYLPEVLETTEAERLATGFKFTEGPLWHPDGFWYFVDLRSNRLHRVTPGKPAELVVNTVGGNGTTFDLQGRLLICEGDARRVSRLTADGKLEPVAERYNGGRFNRPNDIVCRSDGSIFFTDPEKRVPFKDREIAGPPGAENLWDGAAVYRMATDGAITMVANFEYPNGLAFSPDEKTLYVANTRSSKYIHAIAVDLRNHERIGLPDLRGLLRHDAFGAKIRTVVRRVRHVHQLGKDDAGDRRELHSRQLH